MGTEGSGLVGRGRNRRSKREEGVDPVWEERGAKGLA